MELQQVKCFFVDGQCAARLYIDLDGVSIVENFQGTFFVVHAQHVFGFFKRANDVQWRLFFASAADREIVAPVFRPVVALIAPVHVMGFAVFFGRVVFAA